MMNNEMSLRLLDQKTENNLLEPLILPNDSLDTPPPTIFPTNIMKDSNNSTWNYESAQQSKLRLVNRLGLDSDDDTYYYLSWNPTTGKIHVLNESTTEKIETFDPKDIIGCNLEISFDGNNNNNNAATDTNMDDEKTRQVGIFNEKSLPRMENMEKFEKSLQVNLLTTTDAKDLHENIATTTNLFTSDTTSSLSNNSKALLHIHSYPRKIERTGSIIEKIRQCIHPNDTSETEHYHDEHASLQNTNYGFRYPHHGCYEIISNGLEDLSNARNVVHSIRTLARLGHFMTTDDENNKKLLTTSNPTKKYLVVLNPFSGTKNALKIYQQTVKPMLGQCGVDHELLITKHAGHASERMMENYNKNTKKKSKAESSNHTSNENDDYHDSANDISTYDAVIAMGGDGILSEILTGLRARNDYDVLMNTLKFGIVGCGTSNGLAASLLYADKEKYNELESMFLICKGQTSRIDLSTYQTTNKSYTSFLTFSWAIIADVDIESECIRFMGSLRMDLWAVWRVLNLRTYKARLSYLPPKNDAKDEVQSLPALNDPLPPEWITIEDDFILFWSSQVTHASYNVIQSPSSKMQDGLFRLFLVRKPCSRITLARILLGMETGSHTSINKAEFIDCIAYRLEPLESGSFNDLDGEVIESGPIQGFVNPSAISFFRNS